MTTVTKIFVVLVCLFAFVFTPMAISFAARTRNWQALAEHLYDVAETALAHERSTIATAAATIEQFKGLREQERKRAESAEKDAADLQAQIKTISLERQQLERARDNWENSARTLSARMDVIDTNNGKLTAENQRLTQSEQDLQQGLARCQDELAELSSNNTILAEYLRQRKAELAAVRQENEKLRQQLRLGQATEALSPGPTSPVRPAALTARGAIRGAVTQVRDAQGMVSINVGSASGLTEGTTMVVIRGDQYVGDLVISNNITPTEAVGRFTPANGKQIRSGDVVVDEASFMAR